MLWIKRLGWILWSGQWSQSRYARISRSAWKGEFVVERKKRRLHQLRNQLHQLKRRLLLRKHLLHLAHLFHKSRKLLSNRSHRRKPYNLFQDRKNWHFLSINNPKLGPQLEDLSQWLLCLVLFFSGGPSVDGVWLRNTDSSPITYELSGKKQRVNGDETIKKVLKGNEAKKNLIQHFLC